MATIGDVPAAPAVVPGMIVIDGNPADWEGMENVVTLECPEGAEMTGLLSAKILYGKKLYILAKISDEAIADGKVRLHVYFDTDETGGVTQHWNEANIDYMTEGKITNSGAYVPYSSALYQWAGPKEDGSVWNWADSGAALTCKGAGADNIYELSINYSNYPGGLPEQFSIGLDVVNSNWAVFGYLPQTYYKLVIKKDGIAEQPEEPAQAPATIADIIKEIPENATGSKTAVEFEANLKAPAVVSYVNGNNAYIQDETGAILIYLKDHGFKAGDTIKGKLAVKAYWFNGIPEMVGIGTEYEKGTGEAPAPKEITVADLLANYDANLLRLIVLKGVKVTDAIADGDRNGKIAQGESEIAVYAQIDKGGLELTEGATGDFVTIPAYYKTNKQVYLWENAWFTAAAAPAASITLDGKFDDWANIEAIPGRKDGTVTEWKYAYDADNIYFYTKIERSDIKAAKAEDPAGSGLFPFAWRRYFYIGLDTDNNAETPTAETPGKGDLEITGCEALALVYPFRGNATSASGTDGAEVLNGVDAQGWIKLNGNKDEKTMAVWGKIEDDYGYLEMSLPKAAIGSATGKMKVQLSFSSNLADINEIEIK